MDICKTTNRECSECEPCCSHKREDKSVLSKKQLQDAARCGSKSTCFNCLAKPKGMNYRWQCIENPAQTALAYREMLERLEWGYGIDSSYCPECYWEKEEGHKPGCELAEMLK